MKTTNVVFLNGGQFDPKPPLGEGQTRYVKLQHMSDLIELAVVGFIKQSGRTEGWK